MELLKNGKIFTTPELLVTGAKGVDTGEVYLKTVKSGIFGETNHVYARLRDARFHVGCERKTDMYGMMV